MIRIFAALVFSATIASGQTVPEPSDYRMDHYRAPVPDRITGGTTIGPEDAHALWRDESVVFIDVLPQAPKPASLPKDTIWRDKPHDSIPGAIWLPNVGYGTIAKVTADYFRKGLKTATAEDTDHAIVFFCLKDCWMSWNAARRAIEWGYTRVYWFPEGTDGWVLWGHPLERVTPAPDQFIADDG